MPGKKCQSDVATMPNVVGLNLEAATLSLENAGVVVLSSIGYFGTWPISVTWQTASPFNNVTAQNPSQGATVTANSSVILTVNNPKQSIAYP